jgi:hypothetical protein
MKRLQLGKKRWRKQSQPVNAVLKAVSIVHGDGSSGVMPDDVPLLNVMFHPNLLDLFGQGFELPETRGDFRSFPQAG